MSVLTVNKIAARRTSFIDVFRARANERNRLRRVQSPPTDHILAQKDLGVGIDLKHHAKFPRGAIVGESK